VNSPAGAPVEGEALGPVKAGPLVYWIVGGGGAVMGGWIGRGTPI